MLNQRQLYVASKLFVAAGRAGVPFDLSRFSNDRTYAMATLSALAGQLTEPSAQTIVAEAIQTLNEAETPLVAIEPSTQSAIAPMEAGPDKYVGRLR